MCGCCLKFLSAFALSMGVFVFCTRLFELSSRVCAFCFGNVFMFRKRPSASLKRQSLHGYVLDSSGSDNSDDAVVPPTQVASSQDAQCMTQSRGLHFRQGPLAQLGEASISALNKRDVRQHLVRQTKQIEYSFFSRNKWCTTLLACK